MNQNNIEYKCIIKKNMLLQIDYINWFIYYLNEKRIFNNVLLHARTKDILDRNNLSKLDCFFEIIEDFAKCLEDDLCIKENNYRYYKIRLGNIDFIIGKSFNNVVYCEKAVFLSHDKVFNFSQLYNMRDLLIDNYLCILRNEEIKVNNYFYQENKLDGIVRLRK